MFRFVCFAFLAGEWGEGVREYYGVMQKRGMFVNFSRIYETFNSVFLAGGRKGGITEV